MKLKIERLGDNGEGIAIISNGEDAGKIVFVNNALVGEEVDAEVIDSKQRYCQAKLNKLITKSNARVDSACLFYGLCGGCDLQHMNKTCQMDFKLNKVKNAIAKVDKIDNVELIRVNDYNYRNKMVFPIVRMDNRNIIGMFSKKSHQIVEITKCMLADEKINEVLNITREFLQTTKKHGFDFKDNIGDIKYLVTRTIGSQILVTLVVKNKFDLSDYFAMLKNKFENVGLSIVITDNKQDILGGRYIHLFGNEFLDIDEFGIKYRVNNLGFLQINNEIKSKIYTQILQEIDKNDRVIDAYSGAGLLLAIMSKKCKETIGIEINKSASNSANEILKSNDIKNANFICGDVKTHINRVLKENDIVILDPPRTGCDKQVLNSLMIKNIQPKKIIYISCNLSTLIRDLQILKSEYKIKYVKAYDMFVQTNHIEVLTCLQRKE